MDTINDNDNDFDDEDTQPVVPEPGQDVGPHDAPSPDPHDDGKQASDATLLTPEPANDEPEGEPTPPPASEGGHTDAMHLEDDRIRLG